MWLISVLIITLFLVSSCSFNQSKKKHFEDKVYEINLLLDKSQLAEIIKNPWQDIYIPVKVVFKETGDTVSGKIRIRGDSSRGYGKKSFKLKFDKKCPYFNDRKEINLNSAWTDKTYLREYASYLTFEAMGVPVAHTTHIFLNVNGKPYGLYLAIENVDDDFLKLRGFDTKGSLYKAVKDGACLTSKEDVYKLWQRKNNKEESFKDLRDLISMIDTVPYQKFDKFLREHFAYDEFITVLAINIIIQNGSTYYHNYFLYHDLYGNGKWYMFPWDLDKTFAYYNWKPYRFYDTGYNNPLIQKSFLNHTVWNDIKKKMNDIFDIFFNDKILVPKLEKRIKSIDKYIDKDTIDQIKNHNEWKDYVIRELGFVKTRKYKLQKNLSETLPLFNVVSIKHTAIKPPVLRWYPVKDTAKITYKVMLGKEHQLKEKGKTWEMGTTRDTFFVLPDTLHEGHYYWRVIATDNNGRKVWGLGIAEEFDYKKPYVLDHNLNNKTFEFIKSESPYYITKEMNFINCKVTCEPGVEIYFANDISVYFTNSEVSFIGTEFEPIYMMPVGDHFKLVEFDFGNVLLNHIKMINGKITYHKTNLEIRNSNFVVTSTFLDHNASMLWGTKSKVTLSNSYFYSKYDTLGEGINLVKTKAEILSNYIENISDAIEFISSDCTLVMNNFTKHSGDDGIDFNDCDYLRIMNNYLYANKDKGISIGCEQYGPSIGIISVHNSIISNKTGIAAKDSSCVSDTNSVIFGNKVALEAYVKNNYFHFTIGGCVRSYHTIFAKNGSLKYLDKHSKIEMKKAKITDGTDLKRYSKDFLINEDGYGVKVFDVEAKREGDIKVVIIKNRFNYPLRMSKFKLVQGKKTVTTLPDIYLRTGYELVVAEKTKNLPEKFFGDKYKRFVFKCKKLKKLNLNTKAGVVLK